MMDIYMLALQYGIPPETVDAVLPPLLGFLAVLILGKPLASIIIRKTSGGSPGAAAMVWPITIAALILVPLAFALSPAAGAIAWVFMLAVVPYILGRAKRSEEVREITPKAVAPAEDLRQKLLAPKTAKESKPARAKKAVKGEKTTEEKKEQKKRGFGFKLSLPFGRKKEKAEKPVKREGRPKTGKKGKEKESVLVVEEIKLPATATPTKAPAAAPAAAAKPKEAVPALPSPMEQQRQAFLKAVEELEQLAGKAQTAQQAQPAIPAPKQAAAPPEAEKYVEEVARAVEERIVRTGRHRFITWREVREARRRAKEAVKRVKPVVKKKVEETLAKKGRITKEDLDAIAEEIFYQVQKGDVFARETKAPIPAAETEKPKEKPKKRRKKKEEEEELGGGEEDLLALLGEEGGEEALSEGGEEDMDELLKLLGE